MDGLNFVLYGHDMVRIYKVFKGLNIRIIRIEAFGREAGFHRFPVQKNPFHFGGAAVDNQFHASNISEGLRLMSKG